MYSQSIDDSHFLLPAAALCLQPNGISCHHLPQLLFHALPPHLAFLQPLPYLDKGPVPAPCPASIAEVTWSLGVFSPQHDIRASLLDNTTVRTL